MPRFGRFATTIALGSLLAVGLAMMTGAQQQDEASVTFEDQTSDGQTVEVANATLPDGGFVVIRNESEDGLLGDGVLGNDTEILGQSEHLEPGSHENLTIDLNETQSGEANLTAVLYRDSDGDGTFDQDADEAYTRDGEDVSSTATVQFEEDVGQPGESPTPTPDETPEATPGPGAIALLVVASVLIVAARHR